MAYNLYLLPEAKQDILELAQWQTENLDSSGQLASAFLDAIDQTLDLLKDTPELHSFRYDDVRGIRVRRDAPKGKPQKFPHIVFYRFDDPDIIVHQVFAIRDNPEKIRH
ncbi:MAG: type II toxin-antitoxin system RelE/ParE family toxin [Saprospiraceae bacterium]